MTGGKHLVMARRLGWVWQKFNRGEEVPSILVVGPGWRKEDTREGPTACAKVVAVEPMGERKKCSQLS